MWDNDVKSLWKIYLEWCKCTAIMKMMFSMRKFKMWGIFCFVLVSFSWPNLQELEWSTQVCTLRPGMDFLGSACPHWSHAGRFSRWERGSICGLACFMTLHFSSMEIVVLWCQTVLSKTHQRCTFSRFVSAVVKNSQTHQEVPWAGLPLFVAQAHQGISALAHSWKTPTRYWIDIQSEAFTFSQLSKPWRSSHRQHPDH